MFRLKPAARPRTGLAAIIGLLMLAPNALAGIPANSGGEDTPFPPRNEAKEQLGKFLFYDKILSGNRNISCATCHNPLTGTGDGLAVSIGEGGRGLGVMRDTGLGKSAIKERVPRNAPPIFNLGAYEFTVMFHDGRLRSNPSHPFGFETPAGMNFLQGIESPLAAQAAFPVTSAAEMAGQPRENTIANAGAVSDFQTIWQQLTARVVSIKEYAELLQQVYPDLKDPGDATYAHIANAIGAFEAAAWRADNSPYDRYKRGELGAMTVNQIAGMDLFYGKAHCGQCHSGPFQTDQQFHAIGIPQIGPGKGDGFKGRDDFGRERVTGNPADRYKFRTPNLRNVELTGPWGHDGAYDTLEATVRHHLHAAEALNHYDTTQAALPSRFDLDAQDFVVHRHASSRAALTQAIEIPPVSLNEQEIGLLLEFLHALTDPASLDIRYTAPRRVPSGLPLAD